MRLLRVMICTQSIAGARQAPSAPAPTPLLRVLQPPSSHYFIYQIPVSIRRVREYFEEILKCWRWVIFVNRACLILGRVCLSRSRNVLFSPGNGSFERIAGRCFAKGEVGLVFWAAQRGCASVPLIIRYGHRYRVHRNVIFNLNFWFFVGHSCARDVFSGDARARFPWSREAAVAAWQAGRETLLTGRSVQRLVDAEENRASCQASGRHPAFAKRLAVTSRSLRGARANDSVYPRAGILQRLWTLPRFVLRVDGDLAAQEDSGG